jgi:hypothetical protein
VSRDAWSRLTFRTVRSRKRAGLSLLLALGVVAAALTLAAGPAALAAKPAPLVVPRFQNVTAAAGLTTSVPDASCGNFVTGAAWGDVNGDGKLDLFVTRLSAPTQLFVNDGKGHFSDQTAAYGVQSTNAHGAVFADYDNDGRPDLYVVSGGPDILYHNNGNGTFTNVTAAAGISDNLDGSTASWADYNGDGSLDLYVANYAVCQGISSQNWTYHPDKLYRNNGNGTFTDVTPMVEKDPSTTTDGSTLGAGFAAAWFDADNDGRPDLYLGNDYVGPKPDHNHLWMNAGPTSLNDDSIASGTAYSMNTMGIGIGDYDRDGRFDIALSNIRYNRLLRSNGDGTYTDTATLAKIDRRANQSQTQVPVTWGVAFFDFNLDGWEDLYFAAGNVTAGIDTANGIQPNELYVNNRHGGFVDKSTASGAADTGESKGVAFADYDRDGRMDMFVVNQAGTPHLFRNVTPMGKRHWLEVNLVGTRSNRDACGARLVLKTGASPKPMMREVFCGSISVASGSQKAVLFGLDTQKAATSLTIFWPSGKKQVLKNVKGDRFMTVTEPR